MMGNVTFLFLPGCLVFLIVGVLLNPLKTGLPHFGHLAKLVNSLDITKICPCIILRFFSPEKKKKIENFIGKGGVTNVPTHGFSLNFTNS